MKNPRAEEPLLDWAGRIEPNQKVIDGKDGLLNEPSGLWALIQDEIFQGIYVADTGNNCIRFIDSNGVISTPKIDGIPDVRESASECADG